MKNTKNITGKIYLTATKFLYPYFKTEINHQFKKTLENGFYILGDNNRKLETKLAKYLGVKYVYTTASGTDALTLSLKALDLKKDEEVIVPANVYPSVFGIALSGAKIKLADVEPSNLNLSLNTIKKAVTLKTKVIVAVHLYGNPVDINPIKKFSRSKGIYLIEDTAQAIGGEYDNKKVGNFGDLAIFSFYPTKNLAAFGDGGAIATNSKKLAEKIKLLRMYGEKTRYKSVLIGHNSRFDEIQSGIILAQISKLEKMNRKRRKIAQIYKKNLNGLAIFILNETAKSKSVYHLFCIMVDKRDQLMKFLEKRNIETGVHYPVPIHLTKSFSMLGYKKGDFPVSENASKKILSLPMHPFLTKEQILYICCSIKEFFK